MKQYLVKIENEEYRIIPDSYLQDLKKDADKENKELGIAVLCELGNFGNWLDEKEVSMKLAAYNHIKHLIPKDNEYTILRKKINEVINDLEDRLKQN